MIPSDPMEIASVNGHSSKDTGGGSRKNRLRFCPMEPGEPVDGETCSRCQYRPEPPMTICSPPKRPGKPRPRGFWDKDVEPW